MILKEIIGGIVNRLSNYYDFKVVDDSDEVGYDEHEILLEFNRKHMDISALKIENILGDFGDCTYHVAVYSNIVAILISSKTQHTS